MSLSDDLHTIPRLFGDAVEQLGKLVQNEAQLARAELAQKMTQAGIGAAYLVGAAILSIPVLVVLLMALALWLVELGLNQPIALLVAAAVGTTLSVILASVGMSYLKPEHLKPKVTMYQMKQDVTTAKELMR